jgi:hypothetical protein
MRYSLKKYGFFKKLKEVMIDISGDYDFRRAVNFILTALLYFGVTSVTVALASYSMTGDYTHGVPLFRVMFSLIFASHLRLKFLKEL